MQQILQTTPSLFYSIIEQINHILNDGKLDYYDIPKVVLLLSAIYKEYIIEKSIPNVGLLNIVKFTAEILLQKGVIAMPSIESVIVQKLINSSIDLLKMDVEVLHQEEKWCFKLFNFTM